IRPFSFNDAAAVAALAVLPGGPACAHRSDPRRDARGRSSSYADRTGVLGIPLDRLSVRRSGTREYPHNDSKRTVVSALVRDGGCLLRARRFFGLLSGRRGRRALWARRRWRAIRPVTNCR